jgi:hypothetical protein
VATLVFGFQLLNGARHSIKHGLQTLRHATEGLFDVVLGMSGQLEHLERQFHSDKQARSFPGLFTSSYVLHFVIGWDRVLEHR